MPAKNILIITDKIVNSGASTFINGLLGELKTNPNINVISVFFHENPTLNKSLDKNCYPIYLKDCHLLKNLPRRIYLLHQTLKKVAHLNFSFIFTDLIFSTFTLLIARLFISKIKKIPIYHHIHGSFSEEIKSQTFTPLSIKIKIKIYIFYLLEKITLKQCSKIFVYSHYSLNLTKELHGEQLPIQVNRPGVDPSFYSKIRTITKKSARFQLHLNPNSKYILFTSRIEPRKGMIQFFQNLSKHSQLFKDTQFIVCSNFLDSAFYQNFLQCLNQLNLGSQIFLINHPNRHQLSLLYRAATITIMPSIDLETFGFTTLESYYFKTPVVGFDIGANPELIPSQFLVKYKSKNNWQNLYQKINYVISHPDHLDYSQYNFSWKSYLTKII